jgi:hypothetical protein
MALAEIELDPFSYFVEDASSTVTFWPAEVVKVKPDLDTLVTVPDDPPAAGPDRAFDPALADAGCAADAAGAAASPSESPITGAITTTAAIRPIFLFESNRHTLCRRVRSAGVDGFERISENAGGRAGPAPASAELPGRGGKSLRGLVGS